MKKKAIRLFMAFVTVLCLTIPFAFVSFAADEEPLTVTQKATADKDNNITVTLTVKNEVETLYFSDLTLKNEIPEGYELKEKESSEVKVENLPYGAETFAFTTTFVPKTNPKTGDNNSLFLIIGIIVLSGSLIAVLIFSKKARKMFLPIILGFALIGGVLATTAVKTQAAENQETIEKTTKVNVGGKDVEVKSSVTFTKTEIPAKSDLITLDGQTAGEDLENVYRVLKMDGTKATVMSMWAVGTTTFSDGTTTIFTGPGGDTDTKTLLKYEGSDLDTALNTTFYNTLSSGIIKAIVPQTIEQKAYRWTTSNPTLPYWTGDTGSSYIPTYYIENPGYSVSVGERKVYALEVEDVINYLGDGAGNLNAPNLMEMFFNNPGQESRKLCWLRSAYASADEYDNYGAWLVYSEDGFCMLYQDDDYDEQTYEARAAFVIDLSKCEWEKYIPMPEKGELVTLDNQGSGGEDGLTNVYRVLKMDGTKAFVMSMWDVSGTKVTYNTSSQTTTFTGPGGAEDTKTLQQYAGGTLDTYLNGTFYNALSSDIKNAIVPQTIKQKAYGYKTSSPTAPYWSGTYGFTDITDTGTYYIENPGYIAPVGERNVYALEVEDVINYLGDGAENLNVPNLMKMFFDNSSRQSQKFCWLRSAAASSSNWAWAVSGNFGDLGGSGCSTTYEARAAFVVDLSQCAWAPVEKE